MGCEGKENSASAKFVVGLDESFCEEEGGSKTNKKPLSDVGGRGRGENYRVLLASSREESSKEKDRPGGREAARTEPLTRSSTLLPERQKDHLSG